MEVFNLLYYILYLKPVVGQYIEYGSIWRQQNHLYVNLYINTSKSVEEYMSNF